MATEVGSLFVKIGADLTELFSGMGKAQTVLQNFGQQAVGIGQALSVAITVPLSLISVAALKSGLVFDDAFDKIRIRTGKTGEALSSLQKDFEKVFADIPVSAEEASSAIAGLNTRLGLTGEPLEKLAEQELNFARIMKTDINVLVNDTTRLFGDWSIATNEQAEALDYLFKVIQQTGIGTEKLTQLLVQFGAPMRQMGFDFETTAALLGKFEKEGVNTELVMGSLRIALTRMAKAGISDSAEALQKLIEQIKAAGSAGEANAIALDTFGARAGPDMAAAIREGRFEIDSLLKSLSGSSETINKAAKDTDGFSEKLILLKNRAAEALAPLGEKFLSILENLMPVFEKLTSALAFAIGLFDKLPASLQTIVLLFGTLAAVVGPWLIFIGSVVSSVASFLSFATAIAGSATAIAAFNIAIQIVGASIGGFMLIFQNIIAAVTAFGASIVATSTLLITAGIAIEELARRTINYYKVLADLEHLDAQKSTHQYAEALNEVKKVLGDVTNGTQAFLKIQKEGIFDLLKTEEGNKKVLATLKLLSAEQMTLTDRRAKEKQALDSLKESGARKEEIEAQQKIITEIDRQILRIQSQKAEINDTTKAVKQNKQEWQGVTKEIDTATQAIIDQNGIAHNPEIISPEEKAQFNAYVASRQAITDEENRIYDEKIATQEEADKKQQDDKKKRQEEYLSGKHKEADEEKEISDKTIEYAIQNEELFQKTKEEWEAKEKERAEKRRDTEIDVTRKIMDARGEELELELFNIQEELNAYAEAGANKELLLKYEQEAIKKAYEKEAERFKKKEEEKRKELDETQKKREEIDAKIEENQKKQSELESTISGGVFGGGGSDFTFKSVYAGPSLAEKFEADRKNKADLLGLEKEAKTLEEEKIDNIKEEIVQTEELKKSQSALVDLNNQIASSSPWGKMLSELQDYIAKFQEAGDILGGGGGGKGSPPGGGGGGYDLSAAKGFGTKVADYFTLSGASNVSNSSSSNTTNNSTGDININVGGETTSGSMPSNVSSAVSAIQSFALTLAAKGGRQ